MYVTSICKNNPGAIEDMFDVITPAGELIDIPNNINGWNVSRYNGTAIANYCQMKRDDINMLYGCHVHF